jgi:hypothetical protein
MAGLSGRHGWQLDDRITLNGAIVSRVMYLPR